MWKKCKVLEKNIFISNKKVCERHKIFFPVMTPKSYFFTNLAINRLHDFQFQCLDLNLLNLMEVLS